MRAMITILIVDDHDLIRFAIKKILAEHRDMQVIGEADRGEAALRLIRELKPDIVILDIHMPDIDGIEIARRLSHVKPPIKIIALTAQEVDVIPYHLLRLDIAGYLTKTTGLEELIIAIRRVYSGQRYITPHIAQQLALEKNKDPLQSPLTQLSERELQVMLLLSQGETLKSIGDKLCISTKTVATYRYRLYDKLQVRNDVELTHLAIHFGLLGDVTNSKTEAESG
jgi:two-component system, NarL family, invasion response regulator UvrY